MKPSACLALFASVAIAAPWAPWEEENEKNVPEITGSNGVSVVVGTPPVNWEEDDDDDDIPEVPLPETSLKPNETAIMPPPSNSSITAAPTNNTTITPPPTNSTSIMPPPSTGGVDIVSEETVFMTGAANGTTNYIRILNNSTVSTQSARTCESDAQALNVAFQACKDYAIKAKTVVESATEDVVARYFTKGDINTRNKIATRYGLIAEECGRAGQGMLGTTCDSDRCEAGSQTAYGLAYDNNQAQAFYCPLFFSYYDMDDHVLSNKPCLKRRDRMTHGAIVLMHAGFAAANLSFETGTRSEDAYSYANFASIMANPCTATR